MGSQQNGRREEASELENTARVYSERSRERKALKNEPSLGDRGDTTRWFHICAVGVPRKIGGLV